MMNKIKTPNIAPAKHFHPLKQIDIKTLNTANKKSKEKEKENNTVNKTPNLYGRKNLLLHQVKKNLMKVEKPNDNNNNNNQNETSSTANSRTQTISDNNTSRTNSSRVNNNTTNHNKEQIIDRKDKSVDNSLEKIDVESLLKDFKITNLDNFNVYLQQLSKDFCSQSDNPGLGINKMTFLNYFQLPGLIGERLYSVFNTKVNSDYLEVEEFISGMTRLYSANFDSLSKFVFELYDFDKDGVISKEDIRIVLSYIPLIKVKKDTYNKNVVIKNPLKHNCKKEYNNVVESQEELNNLINKSFVDKNKKSIKFMNYPMFFYVVQNISSEIVLYILIYLLTKRPFSKETLRLYDVMILKGISTPQITKKIKINLGTNNKILVPSPSTKSKFSPSLDIKHSPYMKEKEKAKTIMLNSKGQNPNFLNNNNNNAKKLLNSFAKNSPNSNLGSNNNSSNNSVKSQTNNNCKATTINLKPGSFSLSNKNGIDSNLDDIDSLAKVTRIKQKVKSLKFMDDPEDEPTPEGKAIKAVQMRRKYRCFLKGIVDDSEQSNIPSNDNKYIKVQKRSKGNNNSNNSNNNDSNKNITNNKSKENSNSNSLLNSRNSSKTSINENTNDQNAFKYNFKNILQEQIIDEEEEEYKENQKEIKYEGFLYKIKRPPIIHMRYFKLIQKDFYSYENQYESNHKNLHNLSGAFIEKCDNCTINGKSYFCFRIIFSKKTRYYYCDNESEYNIWLEKIRAVTGYSNLNDLYKIDGKLGRGRYGTVKLATKLTTHEEVAIKVLNKDAISPSELELMRTEIEIMKISKHQYIIKLYEVFENRINIFIIMEYCRGGDMYGYLEKRNFKISEHRAAQLTKQIITALYYLHSFGIVHRDIKPENIMMSDNTEKSDIRLADFGLSKLIGPNEKVSGSFGTPGYAAPEVLTDQLYDKSVDYWSVGIVAYLLITGVLPFNDDDPKEIIRMTIYDPVPYDKYIWKNYSREAKNFVFNFLQKDPKKRMNLKLALEHPWIKNHEKIDMNLKKNNTKTNNINNNTHIDKKITDFQKYTHVVGDSDMSVEDNSNCDFGKVNNNLINNNNLMMNNNIKANNMMMNNMINNNMMMNNMINNNMMMNNMINNNFMMNNMINNNMMMNNMINNNFMMNNKNP